VLIADEPTTASTSLSSADPNLIRNLQRAADGGDF